MNSAFRTGKNYQVFPECKYLVKEKKMPEYITVEAEDSDEENSKE